MDLPHRERTTARIYVAEARRPRGYRGRYRRTLAARIHYVSLGALRNLPVPGWTARTR